MKHQKVIWSLEAIHTEHYKGARSCHGNKAINYGRCLRLKLLFNPPLPQYPSWHPDTVCPHIHIFSVIEIHITCSISHNSWVLRKQHRYVFVISNEDKITAFINSDNLGCIFQQKITNQLIWYSETHRMPNYTVTFNNVER